MDPSRMTIAQCAAHAIGRTRSRQKRELVREWRDAMQSALRTAVVEPERRVSGWPEGNRG